MTRLVVSCDSGAHSLYKFKFAPSKKKGRNAMEFRKYDFVKSPEFRKYFDGYMEYLHLNKRRFTCYVALDIIFNGKLSWQFYKEMLNQGFKPIPVYHYGEDKKYLHRYMDTTDYIGIGGVGQDVTLPKFLAFGDSVFNEVKDKRGTPRWKVHGFAMTSVELMKAYPWYSVDSSSWATLARNGWIKFPKLSSNHVDTTEFKWLESSLGIRFPLRSRNSTAYFHKLDPVYQKTITRYLEKFFSFNIRDVSRRYICRDIANAAYFVRVSEELKKHYGKRYGYSEGANLYLASKPSSGIQSVQWLRAFFEAVKEACPQAGSVNYLGTYYYPTDIAKVLELKTKLIEENGNASI